MSDKHPSGLDYAPGRDAVSEELTKRIQALKDYTNRWHSTFVMAQSFRLEARAGESIADAAAQPTEEEEEEDSTPPRSVVTKRVRFGTTKPVTKKRRSRPRW